MTSRILCVLALIGMLTLTGTVAWAADGDAPDPGGAGGGTATGAPAGGDAPDPGGTDDGGGGDKGEGDKGEKKDAEGEKGKGKGSGLFDSPMFLMMIAVVVLMLFMSGRGRKKQAAKQKELLDALKKGDKVRTIGGILGSVVEVRDDEVVLKIDENSNARMRVVRRAIAGQVVDGKKDDEDAK